MNTKMISTQPRVYQVIFDNGGEINIRAVNPLEAMELAERKAEEYGWNLKAVHATERK